MRLPIAASFAHDGTSPHRATCSRRRGGSSGSPRGGPLEHGVHVLGRRHVAARLERLLGALDRPRTPRPGRRGSRSPHSVRTRAPACQSLPTSAVARIGRRDPRARANHDSRTTSRPPLPRRDVRHRRPRRAAGAGQQGAGRRPDRTADRREAALPARGHPSSWCRINGAVQVAAGLMLATGRFPRLSSALLAGSLVPTTLAGHRFWEEEDETRRRPAAHPLLQEPEHARRPDARRRRHRGPPGPGLAGAARRRSTRRRAPGAAARTARREAKLAAHGARRAPARLTVERGPRAAGRTTLAAMVDPWPAAVRRCSRARHGAPARVQVADQPRARPRRPGPIPQHPGRPAASAATPR